MPTKSFSTPIANSVRTDEARRCVIEHLRKRGFRCTASEQGDVCKRGSRFGSHTAISPRKWFASARLCVRGSWLVFDVDVEMPTEQLNRPLSDFWNAEVQGVVDAASGRPATSMLEIEQAISAHAADSRRAELSDVLRALQAPVYAAVVVVAVSLLLPRVVREAFLLITLGIIGKLWVPTLVHWWIFYRTPSEVSRPPEKHPRKTRGDFSA